MPPRLYVPEPPLAPGAELALPAPAARHAQVRRVQPGDALQLFDGRGGQWGAAVVRMGRAEVVVRVGAPQPPAAPELPQKVTLAVGVPANERMDWLVEKASELGLAALQPLQCERSVLRLEGGGAGLAKRAERRRAHWQALAAAACAQCGRATVPAVEPLRRFAEWIVAPPPAGLRLLLSTAPDALPLRAVDTATSAVLALSGPEGGLAPIEEETARLAGYLPVSLGPRVLRADTAPITLLAWLALHP
jgi:16S rRNA (uracil1498-N3)-methyltransferase